MLAKEFLNELKEIDPKGKIIMIIDSYDNETIQRIANQFESGLDFIMEVENI